MDRAITYARVSTAAQGKSGLGLEAQRAAVANYLNGGKWKVLAEYREVESGRRSDRPELLKALSHCRSHGATLIVAKVDRLARSQSFLSKILDAGVDVRFCDLPQIEGPTGRFLLQSMMSVAELEAGMISARTTAALAAAKARGRALGGRRERRLDREAAEAVAVAAAVSVAGPSHDADRAIAAALRAHDALAAALEAHDRTALAAAARRAREARSLHTTTHAHDVELALRAADPDGTASLGVIADRLNRDGVRTPSGKGMWTGTTVSRVRRRLTDVPNGRASSRPQRG